MPKIYPFRALRPRADLTMRVASVPYDVVNTKEARALATGNPDSFLHVTKPEIDLPDDVDPHADEVYAGGGKALQRMIDAGVLVQDAEPCLYAYTLNMGNHQQTGVALCASVPDYDANLVRKHEHTRPDKENDRMQHILSTNAQTGTVFLAHPDSAAIANALAAATSGKPDVDITAEDGIRHRLWVIADKGQIDAIVAGFAALKVIYIADGHHRSAAASRVSAARPDSENASRFLAVSFPNSEMQILPYNRVVKDLRGHKVDEFLAAVAEKFDVVLGKPNPIKPGQYGMYLDGKWRILTPKPGTVDTNDPVARLEVSVLQDLLLRPILGIEDPRRDSRIDFVGGIRCDGELERRVKEGWAVAFNLYPTAIDDVVAVADAGEVMPPKSTWFEPKLRDGLLVHRI